MKILLVSDLDVENGRGPVTRLAHLLPELAQRADVSLVALGKPDDACRRAIRDSGVRVYEVPFALRGWRVVNLPGTVARIAEAAQTEQPDLVVLYREIWDLMRKLPPALERLGIRCAVMPHSVPFLDAAPRPTGSFVWDLLRHLTGERRAHAWSYLLTHAHQAGLMRRLPRLVINETVDFYLERYFPGAPSATAIPGYAVDVLSIQAALPPTGEKPYDVAFMAKLARGKGLFDTLATLHLLRRTRPDARMIVIGSFESSRTERAFYAAIDRLGLRDAVDLAGWLTGSEKYRVLGSARTFCYPSRTADTFSLCVLEALACGLPVACYDVPFARCVYGDTPAVAAVPFGDHHALAHALDRYLAPAAGEIKDAAAQFVTRYSSWTAVAEAELMACQALVRSQANGH
ncbi:glycosyltransferase family 4 protein [Streptomyces umbrinus]